MRRVTDTEAPGAWRGPLPRESVLGTVGVWAAGQCPDALCFSAEDPSHRHRSEWRGSQYRARREEETAGRQERPPARPLAAVRVRCRATA